MTKNAPKRNLYLLLAVALLLTALPAAALAQTDGEPPVREEPVLTDQERSDRLEGAKAHITAEIEKRLTTLDRLTGKIEGAEHLQDDHAASLLGDIGSAREVLRAGLATVAAAETLEGLHEVAPPIFETTLVFALLAPKTHEVIASDAMVGIANRFAGFEAKLQEALDRLAEAGIDVGEAQASLDKAARLIADAAATAGPVADTVINLQPEDWPEPAQAALREGRAVLDQARGSLREAHTLAKEVVAFIRAAAGPQDA